jgi:endonuclease/exonuclease/phosphatase family metal-dependent hydrolase
MAEGILRVVTLNCGSLLEAGWADRRVEVVAWLRELEPDVVCLQEVWEDAGHPCSAGWVADAMPEAGWHRHFGGDAIGARLWPDPSLRFGSAVLSRWPIDGAAYHRLPVVGDDDPYVTDIPWELLHVRTAGLDVFSCHLVAAPRDGRRRQAQVVAIDDIVAAATGDRDAAATPPGEPREGMPAILCGDLNAEPDSDEVRFLTSLTALEGRTTFWQDAWRVAGDGGPGLTQDWRANPSAAALNVHRKRIDYVFVGDAFRRRGGGGRVLSARLAFHEPRTGVLASDHFGLVVEVVWPGRPPA